MRGTPRTRPSVNVTCIIVLLNLTDLASAVGGTNERLAFECWRLAVVLMPRLHELVKVFLDEVPDLNELPTIEPIIGRQSHGHQPELRFITAGFGVDVRRLSAFVAE